RPKGKVVSWLMSARGRRSNLRLDDPGKADRISLAIGRVAGYRPIRRRFLCPYASVPPLNRVSVCQTVSCPLPQGPDSFKRSRTVPLRPRHGELEGTDPALGRRPGRSRSAGDEP